jgi:PAS domain S-box-containing protein
VLILSGLQYGLPFPDTAIAHAVEVLKAQGVSGTDIFVEHLDLARNGQPSQRQALAALLQAKLRDRPVGMLMVLNQPALEFIAQEGRDLAPPDLPVMTIYVEKPDVPWTGPQRPVLNFRNQIDIAGTLRHGLALFPLTQRVLLVASADDSTSPVYAQATEAVAALSQPLKLDTTIALTFDEMLQHVSTLPADTLVLMGTYFNDHTGRSFVPAEVAAEVARRASVPVLGLYDVHIRRGLLGGSVLQAADVGRRAGEIGLELLQGRRRQLGAFTETALPLQPMFDWQQLQRWDADPGALPADTVFLNPPHSLWREYRSSTVSALVVIALLSALVVALAVEIRHPQRLDRAHQRAEGVVRQETEFSSTMLDSMPGAVYFYDLDGRFLRWNRNFESVTGYNAAEIAGMHPLDFFAPEERARVQARIADVFTRGEATVEAHFRSKGGTLTPYFFTGRRVEFNGKPCLVGVGIDVSEQRRVQQALRDNEAQLVAAQRMAGIGNWTLDVVQDRLTASDQTWVICERDAFGQAFPWAEVRQMVHAADRERLDAALRALLAGAAGLDIELRLLTRAGREKHVHVLADATRDAEGRALTVNGTLHDITARVRLAAERQQRERAEAADRVKSAFLATMSHELRTPLNSIIGFTGILLQGLAGPLNAEQSTQLGMVRGSARHLLALVNDVLDISKIEAGQLEISSAPFDLRRAIDRAVGSIRPQAAAKGLALRLELPADLGPVLGDERRFQQIVINLLSNAVKFTEHGEIVLRAQCGPAPDAFTLQVSDTGIGIQAENIPNLFQPFRQIDDGLARQHEGTGLGLAICQRLAGLMGGAITVDSRWGAGSTFALQLHLKRPSPP